jgi:hypothetical protein
MKCGNAHDRLRLGFNACDRDWDGRVTRTEVTMLIAYGLVARPSEPVRRNVYLITLWCQIQGEEHGPSR